MLLEIIHLTVVAIFFDSLGFYNADNCEFTWLLKPMREIILTDLEKFQLHLVKCSPSQFSLFFQTMINIKLDISDYSYLSAFIFSSLNSSCRLYFYVLFSNTLFSKAAKTIRFALVHGNSWESK